MYDKLSLPTISLSVEDRSPRWGCDDNPYFFFQCKFKSLIFYKFIFLKSGSQI